jgi:hypothetical protein
VNVGRTLFSQVMDFVPWTSFDRIVVFAAFRISLRSILCVVGASFNRRKIIKSDARVDGGGWWADGLHAPRAATWCVELVGRALY